MDIDINKLLDGLPLGSYIITLDNKGQPQPILVHEDAQEWVPGEMPFTIPTKLAA